MKFLLFVKRATCVLIPVSIFVILFVQSPMLESHKRRMVSYGDVLSENLTNPSADEMVSNVSKNIASESVTITLRTTTKSKPKVMNLTRKSTLNYKGKTSRTKHRKDGLTKQRRRYKVNPHHGQKKKGASTEGHQLCPSSPQDLGMLCM